MYHINKSIYHKNVKQKKKKHSAKKCHILAINLLFMLPEM